MVETSREHQDLRHVIPEGLSCNTRREKCSRQRPRAESARTYEESGRIEKMTTLGRLDF
jgi:hypothetical protein